MLPVYGWPYDAGQLIPSPQLVAAWYELEILPTDLVPMWAAHWLVQDMDGERLRILAGLDGRDPHEVRDVLVEALADTDTAIPSRSGAAKTVYGDMARLCLAGDGGERWLVSVIERLVITWNYPDEMLTPPLGALYGLDDEWGEGWGRTEPQLVAVVRAARAEQIALVES
ncbi:hypothetical protein ACFQVD_30880 [Streptosporangium amethystogenes subsp. fukuiense]|uniref:Uncharacterized protein n=1 Tax=Streptosporangium amethystogenes subsp. fukuiense TaxID=698418 RepID=A0ABW2T7A7_9ACTN